MKLTKYLSFAVLAGAMLLTNCNKDDESTSPIRPSDAVNINFSVGGKQLTRSNPLGTTEEQVKFNAGDQIAVSVIAPAEQSAVIFKLGSNGTWTETGADFLRWKASAQTFKAVYPESAKDGFTLPTDQSDADKIIAADYMLVETECTRPTNGTDISLRLKRQTARIIVNIASYGDQYASEKQNVSDVKINGITPYNPDNSDQYIALVLPSSIGDAFITLKDGEGKDLKVLRSDINTTFVAGNSYTFNLKVGKDGIKIGNVVVNEWNSATIEGGQAYAVGEEQAAATLSDRLFTEGSVIDIVVQIDDTPFSYSFTYTSTSYYFTSTNNYVTLHGEVDYKELDISGWFEDGATVYFFDGYLNVVDEGNVIYYSLYAEKDFNNTTGMIT
ncbi:MAG: fimbrillin family protein, partial [Bacteroidales bacterium]|nr:fimbrillin family protein [Bacteroidales bacterium]